MEVIHIPYIAEIRMLDVGSPQDIAESAVENTDNSPNSSAAIALSIGFGSEVSVSVSVSVSLTVSVSVFVSVSVSPNQTNLPLLTLRTQQQCKAFHIGVEGIGYTRKLLEKLSK